MVNSAPDQAVLDLYAEFIRLRQTGTNRDDAWYAVLDIAEQGQLRESEVKRLLVLAKGWEKREGYNYHYRGNGSKHETAEAESPIRPIQPRPTPSTQEPPARNAGLTGNLNPDALRAYEQRKLEQVLEQTEERFEPQPIAPIAPAAALKASTQPIRTAVEELTPEYFGAQSVLLLFFKGYQNPIQARLEGEQELMIGRNTANSAMSVDVDLEQVRGGEYGVSRMHGALTRRDNCLLITDVGSMNGTSINGQMLHPHEIRVLRDNDEIWFGQLRCKIRFWHPQKKS